MSKKVLITSRSFGKLSNEPMSILKEAGFEADNMGLDFDMERFEKVLPEYDALIIGAHALSPALLEKCPKLKIICKHGVGLDNIPLEKTRELGITVTNTPGTNSEAVADLTFGLMLDAARCITLSSRYVRENNRSQTVGVDVYKKKLGLLGFGRIARSVARRAAGFDMQVLAYDPYVVEIPSDMPHVSLTSMERIFDECDYISIHLPLTEETRHIIDAEALSKMRKDAILINTARGSVVDEAALFAALSSGQIRAAAMDVTEEEPTSADNPLLSLENVVITNHIGMYSREAISAVSLLCAEAVRDLFSGKVPQNVVH